MSLYEKVATAMRDKDLDGFLSHLDDDYKFVSHQDGTIKDKATFAEMIGNFMSSDALAVNDQRCLYENDDILVSHSVIDFPDGTREAVMTVHKLKDGKIIETETGATPVTG